MTITSQECNDAEVIPRVHSKQACQSLLLAMQIALKTAKLFYNEA